MDTNFTRLNKGYNYNESVSVHTVRSLTLLDSDTMCVSWIHKFILKHCRDKLLKKMFHRKRNPQPIYKIFKVWCSYIL